MKFHVFEDSLAGVARSSNGYPTANEEHERFVVYETFHIIFPKNFYRKIPASCSVYALYTH